MKITATVIVRDPDAEMLRGIHMGEEQHKIHVDVEELVKRFAAEKFPGKLVLIENFGAHDGTPCHRLNKDAG